MKPEMKEASRLIESLCECENNILDFVSCNIRPSEHRTPALNGLRMICEGRQLIQAAFANWNSDTTPKPFLGDRSRNVLRESD